MSRFCVSPSVFAAFFSQVVVLLSLLWLAGCAGPTPELETSVAYAKPKRVMPGQMPPEVASLMQRAGIPQDASGLYVQQLGSGNMLLNVNGQKPFNPASTMKLLTTQAGLELLGPDFTWKTQAYVDGALSDGVLRGDLIFKGSGDPKLVLENFWLFLRQIRREGVQDIQGDVVLDRSLFASVHYDANLFDGAPLRTYNAGPDALLLNHKALSYHLRPDAQQGRVAVTVDPPLADHAILAPRLVQGGCGAWQTQLQASFEESRSAFNGSMAASCGARIWHVHPHQLSNNAYFGAIFRQMWSDLGGRFSGAVRSGQVTPMAQLLTQWESGPLAEISRDINKASNNVMARQLLLTLAAQRMTVPATTEDGATVMRGWLAARNIPAPELIVENGSGLSRQAQVSAQTLGRSLASAYDAPTMPEFMSSLSLVGRDGTMRRRLASTGVAGRAHVKTGSLNAVRAIAGYVLAASGRRYVVVFLVNHPNAAAAPAAQDALLQWVYQNG